MIYLRFVFVILIQAILTRHVSRTQESTGNSVTGVESQLVALNTTALEVTWDTTQTPEKVSIGHFEIYIYPAAESETVEKIHIEYLNDTSNYTYVINGLEPGGHYNVTLEVYYSLEVELTTESSTIATSTTIASIPPPLINFKNLNAVNESSEKFFLYNNTYPENPANVTLAARNASTLVFTWHQEGTADSCSMWTMEADSETSSCTYEAGIIGNLPVAGGSYTISIATVSGQLDSLSATVTHERTSPPTPSSPICLSKTNTSLVFKIPQPEGEYEVDGYDVTVESLVTSFPNVSSSHFNVSANQSEVPLRDLYAGVTYNITLVSTIEGIRSIGSSSTTCTTELNAPLGADILDSNETVILVSWSTPQGHFEGFNVSCLGKNMARNVSTLLNTTTGNRDNPLTAACTGVTAGALYEVSVASLLYDPPSMSNQTQPALDVTVPYPPQSIEPRNASNNWLAIAITYGYKAIESQCTHYEVSLGNVTSTVVKTSDVVMSTFEGLDGDSPYAMVVSAISDHMQEAADSNFTLWRKSRNVVSGTAWTLAPPIKNITLLDINPWSLFVQFDQVDPNENVWQYIILVNNDQGVPVQTIGLVCNEVRGLAETSINCANNSLQENMNITCHGGDTCTRAAGTTGVNDIKGLAEVRGANNSEPKNSICHNISGLEPYIRYSISIQAVNPGGCSWKETVSITTDEWTPGCVNITSYNANFDSLELHWVPPDKPNGNITQYVILYNRTSDSHLENTTTKDTNVTITSLLSSKEYCVIVAAETRVGIGQYLDCPISTVCLQTRIGHPYQPILSIYAINSTSINISWSLTKEIPTGPNTYFNLTITDSQNASWTNETVHVPGFDNRFLIVGDLDEFWEYNVSIVAYTISEDNTTELTTPGESEVIRTLESTSGPVQDFDAVSLSSIKKCYEVNVTWTPPTERDKNGNITQYVFNWTQAGGSQQNRTEVPADIATAVLRVEPNGKAYCFTIQAETSVGLGTSVDACINSTGFCGPDPVDEKKIFPNPSAPSTQTDAFPVLFDSSYFTDNPNGNIIASAILVAENFTDLLDMEEFGNFTQFFEGSLKWSEAIAMTTIPEYRPTPDSWLNDSTIHPPGRRTKRNIHEYIVGDNSDCSRDDPVYCNGPLPSNRQFRVRGLICTQTEGDGCYKTKFVSYIYITILPASEDMIWIVGVIIPIVIILIVLIVLAILYYSRRKRHYEGGSPESRSMDDPNLSNFPLQEVRRPIPIYNFSARVAQMHCNSDLDFNDEYQALQNQSPKHPWKAAELPENRVKNRFVNILPFDITRVKLRDRDDDDDDAGSDYINANYIPDENGIREFIACQGPLASTVEAFWQMIWEQNSRVIVMLTNLKEKGREKCAQYWPDQDGEKSDYGYVEVHLVSTSHTNFYTIRRLMVKKRRERREVLQFHFISWPDFGVPTDPNTLLDFVKEVRTQAGHNTDPPIVVHCSAGVGRTGTFIVLDRLLRKISRIQNEDELDIFGTVFHLRNSRCLMVQTETQYVLIHDCMRLEVESKGFYNPAYSDHYDELGVEESIYENEKLPANNRVNDLLKFKRQEENHFDA